MPFVANRVFGHEPIEIAEEWGLRDIRHGMAYSLCSTVECLACGVLFLDYRFSQRELALLYRDYRGPDYTDTRLKFEPGYAAVANHYGGRAAYISEVEKWLADLLPAKPRVLDWGGDSGVNAPFRFACSTLHVYDISGVEPCPEALGVSLADCAREYYDLISCIQVLEHVPYPLQVLEQATKLMGHSTILYIEVPLEELFTKELVNGERGRLKRHWHEHINFFSPSSLTAMAASLGISVIGSRTMPVDLGWKQAWIQMFACVKP